MIFTSIIVILIALITYFHYAQGFFSATISAIITIIAAVFAVSYAESVVNALLAGKMADDALAAMLCVLFGGIYLILRIIFDMVVPGNLRFPSVVDAVGGAVMGLIAAFFATGVFVLAAQSMGFGPTLAGWGFLPVNSGRRHVIIVATRNQVDAYVSNELSVDTLSPDQEKSLIIPVQSIVLGLVQQLSDGGSLAGERTLHSVHPNWPLELYGQRLGITPGAMHTALNFPPKFQQITVNGVYSVPSLPTKDGELKAVRGIWKIPSETRPSTGQMLLVVRVSIDHKAADTTDGLFRFSTGAVHLVANDKDYFPLGTVYNGTTLLMQKPDDPLFLDLSGAPGAIDFAFMVDRSDVLASGSQSASTTAPKVADGTFISVKRYGLVNLGGDKVKSSIPVPAAAGPMRKIGLATQEHLGVAATGSEASPNGETSPTPTPQHPRPAAPVAPPAAPAIDASSAKVSDELPHTIGVSTTDIDGKNIKVHGGKVSLSNSNMSVVQVDPSVSLAQLANGDNALTALYTPDGKKMVQISTSSNPPSDWAANAQKINLVSGGNKYPCYGLYAIVSNGGKKGLFVSYDAAHPVTSISAPSGTAETVTYIFLVPSGTKLTSVTGAGAPATLSLTAE